MPTPPKAEYKPTQVLPPNREIAAEICARIAQGEILLDILEDVRGDRRYPSRTTLYEWIRNDAHIAEMYDKARAAGFDVMAEKCVKIAAEEVDKIEGKRDPAHVAHKKLQIDTHIKLLGKWAPKRYGDRTELRGNPDEPVVVSVENKIPVADIVAALREAKRKAAE